LPNLPGWCPQQRRTDGQPSFDFAWQENNLPQTELEQQPLTIDYERT